MMKLNEFEIKLVRLAFDLASPEGEHRNATDKLISSLRKRGVDADAFLSNGGSPIGSGSAGAYEALYRKAKNELSGVRVENDSLRADKKRLEHELANALSRKAAQAAAPAGSQAASSRAPRMTAPFSTRLHFSRQSDGFWYATDSAGTKFSVGRNRNWIDLGIKRDWDSKFRTVGKFDNVADAVAEAESRMSR